MAFLAAMLACYAVHVEQESFCGVEALLSSWELLQVEAGKVSRQRQSRSALLIFVRASKDVGALAGLKSAVQGLAVAGLCPHRDMAVSHLNSLLAKAQRLHTIAQSAWSRREFRSLAGLMRSSPKLATAAGAALFAASVLPTTEAAMHNEEDYEVPPCYTAITPMSCSCQPQPIPCSCQSISAQSRSVPSMSCVCSCQYMSI